jgi:hypothetical protein
MMWWLASQEGVSQKHATEFGAYRLGWRRSFDLFLAMGILAWSLAEHRLVLVLMDGQLNLGLWLLTLFFVFSGAAMLVFGGAYVWFALLGGSRWRPSGRMLGLGVALVLAASVHLDWFLAKEVDVWAPLVFSKLSCAWLILSARRVGPDRLRLVCAAWLLACLGFALGLVSSQPVLAMSAGESLTLVAVLLGLFRVFSASSSAG